MRKGVVASNVGGLPARWCPASRLAGAAGGRGGASRRGDGIAERPPSRQEMGIRDVIHCLRLFDINTTVADVEALYLDGLLRKQTGGLYECRSRPCASPRGRDRRRYA